MSDEERNDCSEEGELQQLRQVAEKVFGLRFDKVLRSGSDANVVGMRSDHLLFSRRLDSRTYFVHDSRYGTGREMGVFKGSDQQQFEMCRRILEQLRIPLSEIGQQVVLTEQTQVASIDRETQTVQREAIEEGRHFVRLSRAVEQLPVWSSAMVVGLAQNRSIGYLQLHWPELPSHVVHEAHCLAYRVSHEWKPPEQAGAVVESVEAGIIHSPAIGLVMDICPAIRVIYRPRERGQKPVYFYDRHGKPVPLPRQADMPPEAPLHRGQGQRD